MKKRQIKKLAKRVDRLKKTGKCMLVKSIGEDANLYQHPVLGSFIVKPWSGFKDVIELQLRVKLSDGHREGDDRVINTFNRPKNERERKIMDALASVPGVQARTIDRYECLIFIADAFSWDDVLNPVINALAGAIKA